MNSCYANELKHIYTARKPNLVRFRKKKMAKFEKSKRHNQRFENQIVDDWI